MEDRGARVPASFGVFEVSGNSVIGSTESGIEKID